MKKYEIVISGNDFFSHVEDIKCKDFQEAVTHANALLISLSHRTIEALRIAQIAEIL